MEATISPFARYYFLKADRKFNVFGETSFSFGNYWFQNGNTNSSRARFVGQVSGVLVYFIRPQIGLEFKLQTSADLLNTSSFQVGPRIQGLVGFQIHLNKPTPMVK